MRVQGCFGLFKEFHAPSTQFLGQKLCLGFSDTVMVADSASGFQGSSQEVGPNLVVELCGSFMGDGVGGKGEIDGAPFSG